MLELPGFMQSAPSLHFVCIKQTTMKPLVKFSLYLSFNPNINKEARNSLRIQRIYIKYQNPIKNAKLKNTYCISVGYE